MPTAIQIADSLEPQLRDQFLAMIEVVKLTVPDSQLQIWLDRRDFASIINAYAEAAGRVISHHVVSDLTQTYASLFNRSMAQAVGGLFDFNLISEVVLAGIRTESGKLIVGVNRDTIASIRTILGQSYLDGIGAPAAARILRSVVGLLPQHAAAVGRYASMLQARGIPEPRLTHFTETYARRLLTYRTQNIARTETIAASQAGQVQGWIELANRGILQRHRTRVEWMVTEDDRLCPWCAPMQGKQVGLGELFTANAKGFPDGKPTTMGPGSERMFRTTLRPDPRSQPRDERGRFTSLAKRDNRDYLDGKLVPLRNPIIVMHPPLHPSCRCTLVLRFID